MFVVFNIMKYNKHYEIQQQTYYEIQQTFITCLLQNLLFVKDSLPYVCCQSNILKQFHKRWILQKVDLIH